MKILFLNKCLLFVGIMAFVACQNQPANAPASTETAPAAPKPVIDALRPAVERELKTPVGLQVEMYHAGGGAAFLWAKLTNPDGSPFDFSKTPFAKEYEGGVFSDDVFGLLKNEGGAWKVVASSVGATDVPYMCWWKEYGVAKTAFPEGMAAEDCE